MDKRQIGELTIPVLGIDCYDVQGDALGRVVETALALGYRYFDTAQMWGNEAALGAALAGAGVPREELFIATRIAPDHAAPLQAIASTKESLAALQTDYVDLLTLHAPHPNIPMQETLETLCTIQAAGKCRNIGVADFDTALLQEAISYPLDSPVSADIIEYHPYMETETIRETAVQGAAALIAYYPFAGGAVKEDLALKEIGAAHDKSAAQVALRWAIQQETVCVIVPADDLEALAEYASIFDFSLSDDEMARIAARSAELERPVNPATRLAPDWGWPPREDIDNDPPRDRA